MNAAQDINLNATECIARASDVGGTLIRNVCSGAESYVPWGSGDWVLAVGLGALALTIIGLFLAMAISVVRG